MRSHFTYPSVFQKQDPVAETGAGESVGNEEGGFPRRQIPVLQIQFIFRNGIKRRSRFVQNQDRSIFVQGTRQQKLLLLPSRQLAGIFIDIFDQRRVQPLFK